MNTFVKLLLIAAVAVAVSARRSVNKHRHIGNEIRSSFGSKNDEVIFTPKELPCQVTINRTTVDQEQGQTFLEYETIYVHGTLLKSVFEAPHEPSEEVLYRPDVRIPDASTDKVYCAFYECLEMFDPPCTDTLYEEEALYEMEEEEIDWWEGNWSFDNVTENATFEGQPCKAYYRYDPRQKIDIFLFASEDNDILGINASNPEFYEVIYLGYTYSAIQANFVIDKSKFDSVNDTRAYNRPNYEPCGSSSSTAPSSSTTPSSSTPAPSSHSNFAVGSGAALAVVLIGAFATVLFLF